jgi:molybdate transport system substrate-binding protein
MSFRTGRRTVLGGLAAAAVVAIGRSAAAAEDVHVLAAGAVQRPVEELILLFHKLTGNRVHAKYDTVGALRDKVLAGDEPDLILLSQAGLKALAEKGKLAKGQMTLIGRTSVGLCAPLAAPPADISTPEKLKAVLLAAPSIAHADPARGATAGAHFRKVLEALGILGELGDRIKVVPFGGAIAERVAKGEFAIGVSQATEIVSNKEVRYLGPLPPPHGLSTSYGVGSVKGLRLPHSAAADFALMMFSDIGLETFKRYGFEVEQK